MKIANSRVRKAVAWAALIGATGGLLPAAPNDSGSNEVATNVQHPNGNVYDQLLLTGAAATFGADPGQVTRLSYVDLNDDIVQVEFSGAGSIKITLAGASGPALAKNYEQPAVLYMKGHASLEVSGADASTYINVFSVGPVSAVNQTIFRPGRVYDGIADLGLLEIKPDAQNPNGSVFGGIYAGNVQFWQSQGRTGIYAPNVHVQVRVRIGDVSAYDDATPTLWFGYNSQFESVEVMGGDLAQPNGRLIEIAYEFGVNMLPGTTSYNVSLPAQTARGRLVREDGTVVTIPPSDWPTPGGS